VINVKVEFKGLKELQEGLKKAQGQELKLLIQETLFQFTDGFLVPRIRLNTPILTGKLRESLETIKPPVGRVASVEIQSSVPYALRVHEEPHQLGPVSREQPMQPEGGVGHRFIVRVVDYHAKDLKDHFNNFPGIMVRKLFPSGMKRKLQRRVT
jgi:hypothetical protein